MESREKQVSSLNTLNLHRLVSSSAYFSEVPGGRIQFEFLLVMENFSAAFDFFWRGPTWPALRKEVGVEKREGHLFR